VTGRRGSPPPCCATALLLALAAVAARAQSDDPSRVSTQLWANVTLGKSVRERWYLELDTEPKWQVTSGEEWRNLDLTPLVEHYPADWLDLEAEVTVGKTRQRDELDTVEITPRVGARLHLFGKMIPRLPGPGIERLPLTRFGFSTLVRIEWRNFFYSDESPDRHEWRARLRLESKVALNHATLAADRTVYAMGDVEYFGPLGDDIPERYVNKVRTRLGLGYRASRAARVEVLYIRDSNRSAPEEEKAEDAQAVDVRLKLFF
jgi:hypothetical protein